MLFFVVHSVDVDCSRDFFCVSSPFLMSPRAFVTNIMRYCLSDYVSFHSAASEGNLTSRIKRIKGNGKLFKVSLNIKKCTHVSGRALHQCKKAH